MLFTSNLAHPTPNYNWIMSCSYNFGTIALSAIENIKNQILGAPSRCGVLCYIVSVAQKVMLKLCDRSLQKQLN